MNAQNGELFPERAWIFSTARPRTVGVGWILSAALATALALHGLYAFGSGGQGRVDLESAGALEEAAPVDGAIAKALGEVSAGRIRQTVETLVSFGNRNTLSSMTAGLPPGRGINAAADWIEGELRRYSAECGGCLAVKRDSFTEAADPPPAGRIPVATKISNVYAVLRGSDAARGKRMVLVTGHYDSRNSDTLDVHGEAPGANDDASGVAVSLECARVLSKMKFSGTIVFAAVAGEEQGLNGSSHLAKLAKTEGWQLDAVLNNDIVGGNTTPGESLQDKHLVRVFSEGVPAAATAEETRRIVALGGESDSPSREVARAVAEVARTYAAGERAVRPELIFRRDRFLRGGDHTSFNQQGFAAVRFTEWREDFHHQHQDVRVEGGVQYGDLGKFVDFDYVAAVARLNAAALATLASAPPAPDGVKVVTKELDNNTTLHWVAGTGAPAGTAYEVVWRATSAPDWQRSFAVKAGEAVTVPVSKDNVIFGVRAVDAAGHRSVAVVPQPER